MARTWVKLWTKMLLNPQVAEMPDCLYRRWIEIMLLAGMNDADGLLQPVSTMAYILHIPEPAMREALTSLMQAGVVHQTDDGGWHVTNWKKHQYSDSTDRVRKYREKHRENEGNGARYSNEITPKKADSGALHDSTSTSTSPLIYSDSISILYGFYESEIGVITARMAEVLGSAWDEYPHEWFEPAIAEAVRNNVRRWTYIEAILKRWKVDGFQSKNKNGSPNGKSGSGIKSTGAIAKRRKELERGDTDGDT